MWYMTEERELMRNAARDFVESEVKPVALELEKNDEYPTHLMKRAGELGFLGITFPQEYGGLGGDWTTMALITEEISKSSPSLAVCMGAHSVLAGGPLHMLGTPEQKKKYLMPAAKGDIILACGSTEPAGGMNHMEHSTKAVLDGDQWVLNGGKIFITNSIAADVYIVLAITSDPDPKTRHGISLFLVDSTTPGFEVGKVEHKLGWRGSNAGNIYFKNCRIPKENLLGTVDKAMQPFWMNATDEFMICGALALGMAETCYSMAWKYTHERVQGGKSIYKKYQVIRHKLAKMSIEIEFLRSMLYSTTALRDKGDLTLAQGRMLKIKGYEVSEYVANEAIQLHGGLGVVVDTGIERFWRDAKVLAIGGGAVEALLDDITFIHGMMG